MIQEIKNLKKTAHMFAGPSLPNEPRIYDKIKKSAIKLHEPIKRGDIPILIRTEPPSTIVIVDGYFFQHLAVSHREILDAMNRGWSVWGLGSIGAIRAAEMRSLGVKGYGTVYSYFQNDPDFPDDEVALLHTPNKPYSPITEPLVHLRAITKHLIDINMLNKKDANKAIYELSNIWFGYRTLTSYQSIISKFLNDSSEKLSLELNNIEKFRIKNIDCKNFIQDELW